MVDVLHVSVNQSFRYDYTLSQVETCVERAWPITVAKASRCDRVVAVFEGQPVGAWPIRAVFVTDETYRLNNGKDAPRIGLSLGDPLPILAEYNEPVSLRRGVAVATRDVHPLQHGRKETDDAE